MNKYMPLSVMQPTKISNIPKTCLIILKTPKPNFINKFSVVIEILNFTVYIQKLRKIQKSEPSNLIFSSLELVIKILS
jgi:hypothetical protein